MLRRASGTQLAASASERPLRLQPACVDILALPLSGVLARSGGPCSAALVLPRGLDNHELQLYLKPIQVSCWRLPVSPRFPVC